MPFTSLHFFLDHRRNIMTWIWHCLSSSHCVADSNLKLCQCRRQSSLHTLFIYGFIIFKTDVAQQTTSSSKVAQNTELIAAILIANLIPKIKGLGHPNPVIPGLANRPGSWDFEILVLIPYMLGLSGSAPHRVLLFYAYDVV